MVVHWGRVGRPSALRNAVSSARIPELEAVFVQSAGRARAPPSSTDSAISPRTSRSRGGWNWEESGTGEDPSQCGGELRFVTGWGAVVLIGPRRSFVVRTRWMAAPRRPTRSSSSTAARCRAASRCQAGTEQQLTSARRGGSSSVPSRGWTTRIPAAAAGMAAASHAVATRTRKSSRGLRRSAPSGSVATVAVDADGGDRDENGWRTAKACQRFAEQRGASDAALLDPSLPGRGPTSPDVLAGEVDDGVDTFEVGEIEPARGRIPSDLPARGALGATTGTIRQPCAARNGRSAVPRKPLPPV